MLAFGETLTFEQARNRMVDEQIAAAGISDLAVLATMRRVPRHEFVPPDAVTSAYEGHPLSIGQGQTISQPFIVALMTELARPRSTDIALEVGTGSGYQTAVLAHLVGRVYTIELVEPLAHAARRRLKALGHDNVETRVGDGTVGWSEAAPFDVILMTAAPGHVPQPLLDQLANGGRLVGPVGTAGTQDLMVIEKDRRGETRTKRVIPVRFVQMK